MAKKRKVESAMSDGELRELLERAREQLAELHEETSGLLKEADKELEEVTHERNLLLSALQSVLHHVGQMEGIDHLHGWFARAQSVLKKVGG